MIKKRLSSTVTIVFFISILLYLGIFYFFVNSVLSDDFYYQTDYAYIENLD